MENEESTFYSGYCIKYQGDYAFLLEQLNSQRLADFIAVSSRDFRGGWKAYNKKVLEEFTITKPQDNTMSKKKISNQSKSDLSEIKVKVLTLNFDTF